MKNEPEKTDDFVFVTSSSKLGNRVSMGKTGSLYFNPDNAKDCGLMKIKQVLVGYNPGTGEIALKPCEPDEFGSVMVKETTDKGGKAISANHVVKRMKAAKFYDFRLSGKLIILKPVDENK